MNPRQIKNLSRTYIEAFEAHERARERLLSEGAVREIEPWERKALHALRQNMVDHGLALFRLGLRARDLERAELERHFRRSPLRQRQLYEIACRVS